LRKYALTAVMLLFGSLQILGAVVSILPTALLPLDQAVGTHASVAAGALGIGVCVAAVDPVTNVSWVRISIVYSLMVIAYEVVAHFALDAPFSVPTLLVAVVGAAAMALLYPSRAGLAPPVTRPAGHARGLDPAL